jgi:hypothetical protein
MIYVKENAFYAAAIELPNDLSEPLNSASNGANFRRIDRFIQLALLGASRLKQKTRIDPKSALIMTSGQGDIGVFQRLFAQMFVDETMLKPLDFINSLSNVASFYAAKHLGCDGKSVYCSNADFPVESALILAETYLLSGANDRAILGCLDECFAPVALRRSILGDFAALLGEGSAWFYLSREADGAKASIEIEAKVYSKSEAIEAICLKAAKKMKIAFSKRFTKEEIDDLSVALTLDRYVYEDLCGYYETLPALLAQFAIEDRIDIAHINKNENGYMIFSLKNLTKANEEQR